MGPTLAITHVVVGAAVPGVCRRVVAAAARSLRWSPGWRARTNASTAATQAGWSLADTAATPGAAGVTAGADLIWAVAGRMPCPDRTRTLAAARRRARAVPASTSKILTAAAARDTGPTGPGSYAGGGRRPLGTCRVGGRGRSDAVGSAARSDTWYRRSSHR